ncbi:hypothetical protein VYJ29_004342 [Yersinia enterocolitica]|nr:hypothetical protein [Yersinia enterocolitica]ELI7926753.1 hypothetical protein [Yersinia enterocolitica]ELI7959231.1 hypothetical protein [Yersinia enterocolitica]ELI8139287.1 hypothetical protein [Yersinia enterocolitica]ELI8180105.1 hypothetical protein [Yersinia enterocolitica]
MMDITKSREEFEAEFRKQYAGQPHIEMLLEMYNHGTDEEPEIDYYSLDARDAWKWWQASREIIEVELPEPGYYDRTSQFAVDVYEALRTAGIRIKGESE